MTTMTTATTTTTTPYRVKINKSFAIVENAFIRKTLETNVEKIEEYRNTCNYDNFKEKFPELDPIIWCRWLCHDRDFIYSTRGLHILKTRYLFDNEPIQYCMLRIALKLVGCKSYEFLRITYDLLSCGVLAVSSILAASTYQDIEQDKASSLFTNINVLGEACRLFVLKDDYGINLMNQISYISALLCLGVGVGIDASCIPRKGFTQLGKIRSGFTDLCRKFENCNIMTMHERKPKTTIYVNICYETCLDIFELKIPSKSPLHNVFFGLFIPDLFMEYVRNDRVWYLFSGETKDGENKRLTDYYGNTFVSAYNSWVSKKLYVGEIRARDLMNKILHCQELSGSPYIMWSDHINHFNNQTHLGPIKTSNLCAEIVNYSDENESSSCSLICCNMALFKDNKIVLNRAMKFINDIHRSAIVNDVYNEFNDGNDNGGLAECAKYAYIAGYMASLIMNCFMGENRKRRELGISPMGVQDMALIIDKPPIDVCQTVSEALYRGAIQASCHVAQNKLPTNIIAHNIIDVNYDGSYFSKGLPQWALRGEKTKSNWKQLQLEMIRGMANTMLTAQAPTATTSLLFDNTESVLLAMDIFTVKESEAGRTLSVSYGIMTKYMHDNCDLTKVTLNPPIDDQIEMYKVSAPFIDQTQSVMLSIPLDASTIFYCLKKTWLNKMKTGIYYFNFRQRLTTFQTIRNKDKNNNTIACNRNEGINCDSCTL